MKICAAQIRPINGDISQNIKKHLTLIDLAISKKADLILFPELSITGYEPELAQALAMPIEDCRFDIFAKRSKKHHLSIGIGFPHKNSSLPFISSLLLDPDGSRRVYSKRYLHEDEIPYFSSGENTSSLIDKENYLALAICYEISVKAHVEKAKTKGGKIYLASVAKSVAGMDKAYERLAQIAKQYSMTVILSNCIGFCDNFEAGGKSAIWNKNGKLLGQLDGGSEGIIMIDTKQDRITSLRTPPCQERGGSDPQRGLESG